LSGTGKKAQWKLLVDIQFKDYFSGGSAEYKRYRPQYPDELFVYLSTITSNQQRAWDCATGTGQSALGLSMYYEEVIATDASETQIANALKKDNIHYQVMPAEHTNIEAGTIDLVTVAQALHWFDIKAFSSEVDRVLKDNGVLAAWSYNLLHVQTDIDDLINHLYKTVLGDYWPKERTLIEEEYKSIHLPFHQLQAPLFQMSTKWNLYQLAGYLGTWSAVKSYENALKVNPVEMLYDDMLKLWGEPEQELTVTWPLNVKLWCKKE
jgi:ubiquinone/menaquinone biosynthesis C-methylase UbiE